MSVNFRKISAEEAADCIKHNDTIACSGFTAAGCVKKVTESLAQKAEREHFSGKNFQVRVFSGASTTDHVDGALSRAKAISYRTPYQSNKDTRNAINQGEIAYADQHLSTYPQFINYGFLGDIDYAIVEVSDYTDDGHLTLTMSAGAVPTFCRNAKHIILEHNTFYSGKLQGFHDIYELANPPHRQAIPLLTPSDRIGTTTVKVDPKKIIGVVETCEEDHLADFKAISPIHEKIGQHVAQFFLQEMHGGRIPSSFLPIQSGVGNIANAVLKTMGMEKRIPPFAIYSEVAQDAVIDLMEAERVTFTSACALTLTDAHTKKIFDNLNYYKQRLVIRPEEITNHPEIIRRLGLLALNAALEVDIFGNVNSTHVFGSSIMNGIGGSGDFARNGYISIFTLPSTAKDGAISSIVPFCSHIDHTEHDVQVIVTEQGIADLRGKDPAQRARCIIENCAHPDYKPLLLDYLNLTKNKHIGHNLSAAFKLYQAYAETGDMRNCKFNG